MTLGVCVHLLVLLTVRTESRGLLGPKGIGGGLLSLCPGQQVKRKGVCFRERLGGFVCLAQIHRGSGD